MWQVTPWILMLWVWWSRRRCFLLRTIHGVTSLHPPLTPQISKQTAEGAEKFVNRYSKIVHYVSPHFNTPFFEAFPSDDARSIPQIKNQISLIDNHKSRFQSFNHPCLHTFTLSAREFYPASHPVNSYATGVVISPDMFSATNDSRGDFFLLHQNLALPPHLPVGENGGDVHAPRPVVHIQPCGSLVGVNLFAVY